MTDKVKMIEQLNKGVYGKRLAETMNVDTPTISDIKKGSFYILNFVSVLKHEDGSLSTKMMRTAEKKNWKMQFLHGRATIN